MRRVTRPPQKLFIRTQNLSVFLARLYGRAQEKIIWGNDMKTQMRFQKIVMLATLVVSALTVVYGLIFATPIWAVQELTPSLSTSYRNDPVNADYTYQLFQTYGVVLLWLGVVFLLLVAVCYIMACHKRRNYYITNYISLGVTAGYAVVLAVITIALTAVCHTSFVNDILWDVYYNDYYMSALNQITGVIKYSDDATVCIIGYVIAVLTLAVAALITYSVIWKIKLMKGEKALLGEGLVKEVA